jgi:hypothetical protein
MSKRASWIVALLLAPLGCSREAKPEDYLSFAAIVAHADRVVLYEGMPHQSMETELLTKELSTKQTITLGEYPFYAEPMPLTAKDAAALTEIFDGVDAFYGPPEATVCGPFHPDYAIEWTKDDEKVVILVCFMCSEAIVIAASEKMEFGVAGNPMREVKALLKDRWQNRPETEGAQLPRRHWP